LQAKADWWSFTLGQLRACGPLVIKLCQWLSTRGDVFSADTLSHLSLLQSSAPPHAWEHTQSELDHLMGMSCNLHALC
jgi:predicted unusual protein kinase regulating ubiquinone biosynthesis (AarF/ABC1/UbiB family)